MRAFVPPMVELVAAGGIAAVVWYGGQSVISGERTQGEFIAFLTALLLLYEPFKHLTRTSAAIQTGLAAAERLFELLDERSEVEDRPGAQPLTEVRYGIRFDNVHFRYRQEWVLQGITLEIRTGEVVALVGSERRREEYDSGFDPYAFTTYKKGRVAIDGTDIRDVTLASLRSRLATVSQSRSSSTILFGIILPTGWRRRRRQTLSPRRTPPMRMILSWICPRV